MSKFGYNYKIVPVNVEKNVYKLSPTLGTYIKAFAPMIVLWGGLALAGTILNQKANIEFDASIDTEDPEEN